MLTLLRSNQDYRNLWLGQAISLLGDAIRTWAMVFWVYKTSGESPLMQAFAVISALAPVVVLGPIAGVLVDRWDRKRTMFISDIIRGVIAIGMIPAVLSGQIWILLIMVFLSSCVAQFFDPSRAAMIPRVVGRDQLITASSLGQTTRTIIELAGPGLGTAIYLYLGAQLSFGINAAAFFLSAVFIAKVRQSGTVERATDAAKPAFWPEFKAGVRYCWHTPFLRTLMIGIGILFAGAGAVNTLSIFAVRGLGLGEESVAMTGTIQPTATLIMSIILGSLAARIKRPPLLVPAGIFLLSIGIAAFALATNLMGIIVGVCFLGMGMALSNMGMAVTMQSLVPNDMMGRVQGSLMPIPMLFMLSSATAAGALAEYLHYGYVFLGAAALCLVSVVVTFTGLRTVTIPSRDQAA